MSSKLKTIMNIKKKKVIRRKITWHLTLKITIYRYLQKILNLKKINMIFNRSNVRSNNCNNKLKSLNNHNNLISVL